MFVFLVCCVVFCVALILALYFSFKITKRQIQGYSFESGYIFSFDFFKGIYLSSKTKKYCFVYFRFCNILCILITPLFFLKYFFNLIDQILSQAGIVPIFLTLFYITNLFFVLFVYEMFENVLKKKEIKGLRKMYRYWFIFANFFLLVCLTFILFCSPLFLIILWSLNTQHDFIIYSLLTVLFDLLIILEIIDFKEKIANAKGKSYLASSRDGVTNEDIDEL